MEVATAMDFDFSSSPYIDANYYTSAPSSPTRLTELYCEFDELLIAAAAGSNCRATVPFAWEEKPGVPKTPKSSLFEEDFSFDVSCHFDFDSVPAEELFQGGRIKTIIAPVTDKKIERERGRERGFSSSSRLPSSRSRRTRSLSPLGASDYRRERERQPIAMINTKPPSTVTSSTESGSKKWSFKDLFLFRSASDGRAMDKDPLKKLYSNVLRKNDKDLTNSSEPGSMSRRRGRVSAHELHYNLNRAASNDMKKKTYLPYKQGILGGLAFNS